MSRSLSAVEPKRQRGRLRVAAIMDAGAALFAERGFDAATMTEIAARSGTAIGSLYRFFPTKETLADALIQRYAEHLLGGLSEIVAASAALSAEQLADRLVDLMLDTIGDRTVAIALVDRSEDSIGKRSELRNGMCTGLAHALTAQNHRRTEAQANVMAPVLQHLLKSVPAFVTEGGNQSADRIGEVRKLAALYIGRN
jgi:AcrR family transcriptional regulator